uniref:Uncharacterized protein n=1 Tax=Rhizophora mucronata TaxID=61149 RepID=A0A2P2R1W7_RHIMU
MEQDICLHLLNVTANLKIRQIGLG